MANAYLPGVVQIPSSLLITAATRAFPMVITVAIGNTSTEANTYIVGQNVRMTVPTTYGMFQANGLVGTITAVNGSNLTLNLDSSGFDAFVVPSGVTVQQPASIAPFGSRNLEFSNQTNQVPFQSLNNIGN